MPAVFDVTKSWSAREHAQPFSPEDYEDATGLFVALRRFLATYTGEFVLQIDQYRLKFDLDPDLSTIFEELPDTLKRLTQRGATAELFFFEQGTDVRLLFERQDGTIRIQVEKGQYAGRQFLAIPHTPFVVPARAFLKAWGAFAHAVLDTLKQSEPGLVNDKSFQKYKDSIEELPVGG